MRPIMQQAGDLIMSHFRQEITISYKHTLGIQTNVDLLVESLLKQQLCAALPGSGFIAEESKIQEIKEFTWVIDPIDGTKNFAKGLPYFCINVALMHYHEVIAAVTYQPVTKEWFYSQKDYGFWLNDQQLRLKKGWKQTGALIVVSDAMLRNADFLNQLKASLKDVECGVRFRVNGAAALDLAYVACGVFDLVIFQNLAWWDMAAGVLLVCEAGGMVSQHDGLPVTLKAKTLIAGDTELCHKVMSILHV